MLGLTSLARATELPPLVVQELQKQDANVRIRFDGLVCFSNAECYLPVLPRQEDSKPVQPTKRLYQVPEKAKYPDLIAYDTHFFLLRMVPTATGKFTLPRLESYPIDLKEGMLPQDLLLPANLSIPTELKVILGALPYQPPAAADATVIAGPPVKPTPLPPFASPNGKEIEPSTPSKKPPTEANSGPKKLPPVFTLPAESASTAKPALYLADLLLQQLLSVDPATGKPAWQVGLNCLPSAVLPSPDGKLVYVSCLSSDELVSVDVQAGFIKGRLKVGSRPQNLAWLPDGRLVVSNRFSEFVSLVDAPALSAAEPVQLLGGKPGVMDFSTFRKTLYIADATLGKLYELDPVKRTVLRTLVVPDGVSALGYGQAAGGQQAGQIWVASRNKQQLTILDEATGKPLKALSIGSKPSALVITPDSVLLLTSGDGRIQQFNRMTLEPGSSLELPQGTFPKEMALTADGQKLYVMAGATNDVFVVNAQALLLEKTLSAGSKSVALGFYDPAAGSGSQELPSQVVTPAASPQTQGMLMNQPVAKKEIRQKPARRSKKALKEPISLDSSAAP
jgi:DNA-binding beta-propeller fold protein YncE